MLRSGLAIVAILVLAACVSRPSADDAAFHAAVLDGRAGTEVTVSGTLASQPFQVGDHERMSLAVATGERPEIDHNTRLSSWVPARAGDRVVVHGQLYLDARGPGIHCTHQHTSSGCPRPGWIRLNGTYYE